MSAFGQGGVSRGGGRPARQDIQNRFRVYPVSLLALGAGCGVPSLCGPLDIPCAFPFLLLPPFEIPSSCLFSALLALSFLKLSLSLVFGVPSGAKRSLLGGGSMQSIYGLVFPHLKIACKKDARIRQGVLCFGKI